HDAALAQGEGSVMVTTNDMLFLAADEAGIDGAIDTLMELAGLDSITRAVPVTLRFVFEETM
ncbi:MAG: YceI family protein, partial [Pseudomonadota bacterium]